MMRQSEFKMKLDPELGRHKTTNLWRRNDGCV